VEERLLAAEADREERARRAVADERARIARELHDVVAHHVSLIGVQAGAARTTLDRDGEATRRALSGIEASSREAVREMRRLLEVLDGDGSTPLTAPPGPAEFDALAAGFAAAGLGVRCTRTGDPDGLGDLHALTLYRIAEEALTNVTRHSQARTCTLSLHVDERAARVVVRDPGPSHRRAPVPPPGAGRGLAGMRERVALFGGTLEAGPAAGAGFLVDATLPRVP
jgi:signal transduction histidine kinase